MSRLSVCNRWSLLGLAFLLGVPRTVWADPGFVGHRPLAVSSQCAVPVVLDVRLHGAEGLLRGCVVDRRGLALRRHRVVLRRAGVVVAEAVTDSHGRFSMRGLNNGVHEVECSGSAVVMRLWRYSTAPPCSRDVLRVGMGDVVVRGQDNWTPWFSKDRVVTAAMVGGAALAPVAVINQRRPGS